MAKKKKPAPRPPLREYQEPPHPLASMTPPNQLCRQLLHLRRRQQGEVFVREYVEQGRGYDDTGKKKNDVCVTWLDPFRLQALLVESQCIQQEAAKVLARGAWDESALLRVLGEVRTIFEEQLLVELVEQFDNVADLITEYALAEACRKLEERNE